MSEKPISEIPATSRPNPESHVVQQALPWLVGVAIFLVYLYTMAPTIIGGDTGELVSVACSGGVAHPPGYPLFTLLATLFTYVPGGPIAWRINLLSAVCDSLAAVIILKTVKRWSGNLWAGVLAAGLFAFAPVIWANAVAAEVFALNNLLIALMLYLAVRFSENREFKFAYLTALVFGLGIANHHTCLFYGIPIMIWILLIGGRELWTIKRLLTIGACFVAGLIPYIYLPIADLRNAPVSWGHTSTFKGFLTHFFRSEYGTLNLGANESSFGNYLILGLTEYFAALPRETMFVGVVLAVIGVYHAMTVRKNRGLALVTLIAFAFYLIVFHVLANVPIEQPLYLKIQSRFWQQSNLMVCIWAGLGFGLIAKYFQRLDWQGPITIGLCFIIVMGHAALNFRDSDQSSNLNVYTYARELLRPLPQNAVIWSREDTITFPVAYIQQCEGYRTDVRVINREMLKAPWMTRLVKANYPDLHFPGNAYLRGTGAYNMKQLLEANPQPEMFVNRLEYDRPADWSWNEDYALWPFGMLSWIVPLNQQLDPQAYVTQTKEALPQLDVAALRRYPEGSWENEILKYYWEAHLNRSRQLIDYAIARGDDRVMLEEGVAELERIAASLPAIDPGVYKTMNLAYSKLAVYDPAYQRKAEDAWSKYLHRTAGP
jgi:Protein of unknown function (DUF2723)